MLDEGEFSVQQLKVIGFVRPLKILRDLSSDRREPGWFLSVVLYDILVREDRIFEIISVFILSEVASSLWYKIHSLTPRHYNPCRVLADSRSRLQPSLSLALLFQFLTPSPSASLFTPSLLGLVFPLAFCPPACPRWFSYKVDYLAFVLYALPIWAWLS